MNNRKTGAVYENKVCDHLIRCGYTILDRNFYSRYGEIDIIALKDGNICFVEVKYRKDSQTGYPEEAISPSKVRKICKTSAYYISSHRQFSNLQMRFDVACILGDDISYYENAFEYQC